MRTKRYYEIIEIATNQPIDNIEYITFSLISNIKNQLIYDDKIIDIDKDCLYIIKVIIK